MATFFVNEGESIQAAINLANAGDTVIVAAGTYNESIVINDDIVTKLATATMVDEADRWKIADSTVIRRWPGAVSCGE